MTLAALMASDVADVFLDTEEHAETVVYRPVGKAIVENVKAVVEMTENTEVTETDGGRVRMLRGTVFLGSAIVTECRNGDGIDIRSKLFRVEMAENDGFGLWTLGVIRHETVERTRRGRLDQAYFEDG